MSKKGKNEGCIEIVIHLKPDTDEIIRRHCFDTGAKRKSFIQDCCDSIAAKIKEELPESIIKQKPKRFAGVADFPLPNQSPRA